MIDTIATVESNELSSSTSARAYGLLRLRLSVRTEVQPGQFAMLKPHGCIEPLLRRAMAYYRCEQSGNQTLLEFIYQILGRGTRALAALGPGDRVDILGPLGNTFDVETAGREAWLVAGGVGSAALFMLAEKLRHARTPVRLFIGGASRGDLCALDAFTVLLEPRNVVTATIDGSHGLKGLVTSPFDEHLRENREVMVYACGPDAMLHRVSQITGASGVASQLSLEAPMACGFGICVGCAVAVKADCAEGFVYKKVCTDGPVFRGMELYF